MAYATLDDLIRRYDTQIIGDVVGDGRSRVAESDLLGNENIETALESASGRVNSAVLRGDRYRVEDLQSLTGVDAEFLKDIVCTLAFMYLNRRKGYGDTNESMTRMMDMANDVLKDLASGAAIFNTDDARNAGNAKVIGPGRVEMATEWQLVVDEARPGFYPSRRTYRNR